MSVPEFRERDPDIVAQLSEARGAWSAGRRDEARRRWRMVVAREPALAAPYVNLAGAEAGGDRGAGAWLESAARMLMVGDPAVARNLGVLAQRRGDTDAALGCLRRAAVLAPDDPATAGVMMKLPAGSEPGRDAIRWSMRAVLSDPGQEASWVDLVVRLLHDGRAPEAAAWATRIPIPADAWSYKLLRLVAHAYSRTGYDAEAIPLLARLIGREPYDGSLHILQALVHRRTGDLEAAVRHARRGVLVAPGSLDTLAPLGAELARADRHAEAARLLRRALRIDPDRRAETVENLGAALLKLDDGEETGRVLREALVRRPHAPGGYLNASTLALQATDLDAASRYGRMAVIAGPWVADAHYNLGSIRRHQGRVAEARSALDAAVALDDKPMYRYVRAMLELGDGDPVDGLQRYAVRWDIAAFSASRRLGADPSLPLPVWQGEPRPDATLAVWAEQGIGDELWFAGYLAWAAGRVGRVVVEVAASLVGLLRRSFPDIDVRARYEDGTEAAIAAADLQIPMGDLMRLCGAATMPVPTGYLCPDPAEVERLAAVYRADRPDARVVGLSWRSVKPLRGRSFEAPLGDWGPLFALDDTVFVSLQYGDVAADVRLVAERFGRELVCSPEIDAYRDLDAFAAQVAAVDHVVSIANSTVAMAHGLGKCVDVVARTIQDDWRYARRAPVTRWLPTARIAWQTDGQDWATPIRQLAERIGREP